MEGVQLFMCITKHVWVLNPLQMLVCPDVVRACLLDECYLGFKTASMSLRVVVCSVRRCVDGTC